MADGDKSWFLRRHDYRPSEIGMTEPDEEPISVGVPPSDQNRDQLIHNLINRLDIRLDRTNDILEELLDIQYHNQVTDEDIDVSDSVNYDLAASVAAIVSYKVPDDYVLLLREFNTSLISDTTYYVYLDDEVFQYVSDMEFPGMGLPIESGVTFKMYVLNTYGASQNYTTTINASLRRNVDWKYSRRSFRIPV